MTNPTTNATNVAAKKEIKKSNKVAKATNELIALTLKEAKLADFASLTMAQAKEVNAMLIKKEKHYLPKTITPREEKTYRSSNRAKIVQACKKVIKGKFEGDAKDLHTFRMFLLAKYNIDAKAIDCKTFDFASIYSNAEAKADVKIICEAMQKAKA